MRQFTTKRPLPPTILCNCCKKRKPLSEFIVFGHSRAIYACNDCAPNYYGKREWAHRLVSLALANGTLKKPDKCEYCGKHPEKSNHLHAHHPDYSKPLYIVWLCPVCHADETFNRKKNRSHAA